MRRAYKFRIYPTCGQASRAALCLRDHQRLYNAALGERREAWQRRKVSVRYGQQSAQLRDIRGFDPDQGRWSFSSQQATLRRLDKAMAAFCRRCKAGQAPGYPRFKALDRWDYPCGNRCLRPRQALVICPVHGGMDADVNGAKNIYTRAGLGSGQVATAACEACGFSRRSSHPRSPNSLPGCPVVHGGAEWRTACHPLFYCQCGIL